MDKILVMVAAGHVSIYLPFRSSVTVSFPVFRSQEIVVVLLIHFLEYFHTRFLRVKTGNAPIYTVLTICLYG
jgi:hypothetical protein